MSTSLRLFIREALEQITFMKKTAGSSESNKDTEETSRAASILSVATDIYNFKNMLPRRGGSWRSAWTSARGNRAAKAGALGGAIFLAAWAAGKFTKEDEENAEKAEAGAKIIDEILAGVDDILARERTKIIIGLRTPEIISLTGYVAPDQVANLTEKFTANYDSRAKKIQELNYANNDDQPADYEEFFTSSQIYDRLKSQFDALINKHAKGDQKASDAYKVLISRILLADLCSSIQTSMSRDVDLFVSRLSSADDAEKKDIEEQMTKLVEGFDEIIDNSQAVIVTAASLKDGS